MLRLPPKILNFMLRPQSYPHEVSAVQHLETHISHLFLTGDFAYKIKKAVQFDFLDFRTLERRRTFCEREVSLNRRYAPELYIRTVAITDDDGQLSFEGTGRPVEYAVLMHEFDNRLLFTNLLSRGELTEELLLQLTDTIVNFHRQAEPRPQFWDPETVTDLARANLEVIDRFSPQVVPSDLSHALFTATNRALAAAFDCIQARQKTAVRFVHGDLHLGNICVYQGKPIPFDGIEFNDRYACCDVWADFAFLIMDLLFREHGDLALPVLNRYLEGTDDFEGLPLLPLYLSYRSAVRAKVALLTANDCNEVGEQHRLKETALSYIRFALNSLTPVGKPVVYAIGGLSGSGKSTVARALARKIGGVHIRSDAIRKHLAGVALKESAPLTAYSSEMSARTYAGLIERMELAFQCGRPVILDAVFPHHRERAAVEAAVHNLHGEFHGIWCEAPDEVIRRRLRCRKGDISDADEVIYERQKQSVVKPQGWEILHTSGDVLVSLPANTLKESS